MLCFVCLGSNTVLWTFQLREEVKEVFVQFLIPSADYQIFSCGFTGTFLLSGWIYTVCVCKLYLDYALMCHNDDKEVCNSGQASVPAFNKKHILILYFICNT